MFDIAAALETGLIGSYSIQRELGRGGMARVFLARDAKHDRQVALKVLDPDLARAIGAERFLREIKVAARLQHPHILTVHDSGEIPASGETPALLWFTMPYVEGETLRDRLRREEQLPLGDAITIARETAEALAYAHQHGIVHRDIKPENLLLTGGHTMVADFGVARALGDEVQQITGTGFAIGTPGYMSPEQAAAGQVDARSDIYALGCVLYEMIAGQPPFAAPTPMQVVARVMTEPYRPLRSLRETVPPALDHVVAKALARSPADRFPTAEELARSLRPEILTSGERPSEAPRRRSSILAVAGALLLLILAVIGFVLLNRTPGLEGLDPDVIAVAPFDLVSSDPELAIWSEGIVDVVARYFDGAGTLRAVAPTRAIRAWDGRADRESAVRFGQHLSARYVVFGQLVGSDSLRLTATLFDLEGATVLDEHEWRGSIQQIDRLADSLATRFLDVLGRTRQLGGRRGDPIGTANPLAIRAFLSGMRDLRRAAYSEAARHFAEAGTQDSGFVLSRLYEIEANAWLHSGADPSVIQMSFAAAARNHGLTRRDSLLVVADSLDAAIYSNRSGPPFFLMSRLMTVMDTLLAAFPDDPEVVYWVMDENHHLNSLGKSERWHLNGFRHAIALDPLFAPAYEHAIELSAMLDPPEETRSLIQGMLAIPAIDSVRAAALRLADHLLDSGVSPAAKQAALDSAPEPVLRRAWSFVSDAPDSIGIVAARTLLARFPRSPNGRERLMNQLIYHGRLQEAARASSNATNPPNRLLVARDLALLGIIPRAVFDSMNDPRWDDPARLAPALGAPLWVAAKDTVRLRRIYERSQSAHRTAPPDAKAYTTIGVEFFGAALQLVQGDSSGFRSYRISGLVPPGMRAETPFGLLPAEIMLAFHRDDEAWALLQSRGGSGGVTRILWMLYRARLAEKRGEKTIALDDYGFVARLWANADEPLRSFAREAKEGLARLSAEP